MAQVSLQYLVVHYLVTFASTSMISKQFVNAGFNRRSLSHSRAFCNLNYQSFFASAGTDTGATKSNESCSFLHRDSNLSRCRYFASIIHRGGGGEPGVSTSTVVSDSKSDDDAQELIRKELIASNEQPISTDTKHGRKRVYIAVGTNMGERFHNLMTALSMLRGTTVQDIRDLIGTEIEIKHREDQDTEPLVLVAIKRTSFLRETAPMYITDQPSFLNGVVEIETNLSPHALLLRLKHIESEIGRDLNDGIRYGPRCVDLDIIYYGAKENDNDTGNGNDGGECIQSSVLQIPHPRMKERDFVLSPLCDLDKSILHPSLHLTAEEMLRNLELDKAVSSISSENEDEDEEPPAVKVLPLPRGRMLSFNRTQIMGILNVTPDSFSDGGNYKGSVDVAVQQALQMIEDGADIIDIGGESTRPGAKEVAIEIEMDRTIPVIRKLREISDVPISIDTRHATVANAAIEAGADIVNDVSGGTYDEGMFETVGKLQVPMIIMHMRGTPETMQSMTQYDDVVSEVSCALMKQSEMAEKAFIPRWLQVLDPGIGFAKDLEQNLSLMKDSSKMRMMVNNIPLLLGPSRKGFIGKIAGEAIAENRDFGTLASCLACLTDVNGDLSSTILRVHNVKGIKQGIQVMEMILNAN